MKVKNLPRSFGKKYLSLQSSVASQLIKGHWFCYGGVCIIIFLISILARKKTIIPATPPKSYINKNKKI